MAVAMAAVTAAAVTVTAAAVTATATATATATVTVIKQGTVSLREHDSRGEQHGIRNQTQSEIQEKGLFAMTLKRDES
jgi:hypothetical protein